MDTSRRTYYLRYIYRSSDKVLERKRKKKAKAVEYLGGKCYKCGGIFPHCVYDFHHIDPSIKKATASHFLNWSWNKFKEELDKCILLCANCHRIEHYQDTQKGKEMNDQSTIEQVPAPETPINTFIEGTKEGEVTVHVQTEEEVGVQDEQRVLM